MSIVINSNSAASYSALNMKRANDLLSKSLQRLSSGKRIVSPADDAGGLAVGLKLQSSLKRAAASRMNTQNGVSFLQMQDGVMKVGGEILDRMAELKSFFNDISKNSSDRETYNHEFHELQTELNNLRSQKFNGVSLFATSEPDNNPLKIITSDDGLGEHIELSRTGLFENFKSKFGADSVLNSGSHGEYRQLVGNFTKDGGLTDASPGSTSRAYSQGDVVFMAGGLASKSGYFMALTDVQSGVKIEDTVSPTSQWIRLADSSGVGFAESYPNASEFDPNSMKYNSSGDVVAYLQDDLIKVPAHWSSPGSYLFLRANADVPRGMTLADIFSEDANGNSLYIGSDKYFDYVGKDSSNQNGVPNKPTTEYVRANINLSEPSLFTSGSAAALLDSITSNAANGFNPQFVKSGDDIYTTAYDWDLKEYNSLFSYNYGDFVFDSTNNTVSQMHSTVKGTWGAGNYATGDYVQHDGIWHQVTGATGASSTDAPHNPNTAASYNANNAYSEGDALVIASTAANNKGQIVVATSVMKGEFDSRATYAANDIVHEGTKFYSVNAQAATDLSRDWTAGAYATGDIIRFGGNYYEMTGGANLTAADTTNPSADTANWNNIGTSVATVLAKAGAAANITGTIADVTTAVANDANGAAATGTYFAKSPFQAFSTADGTTAIGDPTANRDGAGVVGNNTGALDYTAQFADVNNTKYWSKTHYGSLDGLTVNASYQYGDNIYYQGKHYIYSSHLSSENFKYLEGADPGNGYTEFENLVKYGAVVELPMYVDTIGGGGGAGLPEGVYYRPNQSLNYVDRLSDSGTVRTNNVERRSEVFNPPGDEIFNTQDDQFYGGLNSGNDGIYGTMDDFYSTTVDPNIALNGGHVDADADNNKDLLNTANGLENFSVADFVDYIQTLANVRAVNGGTQSRLGYANRILEENEINLGAATSRIMDADMAYESTKLASQNVLLQAGASMVTQANSLTSIVLSLLQ